MRMNCKIGPLFVLNSGFTENTDIPYDRLGKYKSCTPLKNRNMFIVKLHTWQKARDSAEVQGSLTGGAFYHFVRETEKHLKSKYCVNHKEWGVSFFPVFTSRTCMCLELPGGILKLRSACCRGKRIFTNTSCSSHIEE